MANLIAPENNYGVPNGRTLPIAINNVEETPVGLLNKALNLNVKDYQSGIDIDYNPYKTYEKLGGEVDFYLGEDMAKKASEEQSGWQQLGYATGGGVVLGLMRGIRGIAMIPAALRLMDYNAPVIQALTENINNFSEEVPIYNDPNNVMALNSSSILGGLQSGIASTIEFALPSLVMGGAGKLIGTGITALGRVLGASNSTLVRGALIRASNSGLNQTISRLAAENPIAANMLTEHIKSVPLGIASNQLEGSIMAVEAYNRKLKELQDLGVPNAEELAREFGNTIRNQNTALILQDILQMGAIFGNKSWGKTKLFQALPNADDFKLYKLKNWRHENPLVQALNEGAEEMIQNGMETNIENQLNKKIIDSNDGKFAYDEETGEGLKYDSKLGTGLGAILKASFTEQGLYEGVIGAFSGPAQNLATSIGPNIKDKRTHDKYVKEIERLQGLKDNTEDEMQKNAYQRKIDEVVQLKNNTRRGRIALEEDQVLQNEENLIKNLGDIANSIDQYNNAIVTGDEVAQDIIENNMFSNIVRNNLRNGTTDHLAELLQDIRDKGSKAESLFEAPITDEQSEQADKFLTALQNKRKNWERNIHKPNGEAIFNAQENASILSNSIDKQTKIVNEEEEKLNKKIDLLNKDFGTDYTIESMKNVDSIVGTLDETIKSKDDKVKELKNEIKKLNWKKTKLNNKKNKTPEDKELFLDLRDEIELKRAEIELEEKEKQELKNKKDKYDKSKDSISSINTTQYDIEKSKFNELKNAFIQNEKELNYLTEAQHQDLANKINNIFNKHFTPGNINKESYKKAKKELNELKKVIASRKFINKEGKENLNKIIDSGLLYFGLANTINNKRSREQQERANKIKGEEFIQGLVAKNEFVSFKLKNGKFGIAQIQSVDDENITFITQQNGEGITFDLTKDDFLDKFKNKIINLSNKDEYNKYVRTQSSEYNTINKLITGKSYIEYTNSKGKKVVGQFNGNISNNNAYLKVNDKETIILKIDELIAQLKNGKLREISKEEFDKLNPKQETKKGNKKEENKEAVETPFGMEEETDSPNPLTLDEFEALVEEGGEDSSNFFIPTEIEIGESQEEDKKRLTQPANSVAYVSKKFDIDGNIINDEGEEVDITRRINSNDYTDETPILVVPSQEGEIKNFEIQLLFDGDSNNNNKSYVPTIDTTLTTRGAARGVFATTNKSGDDLEPILTSDGEEVIKLLEQYYNAKTNEEKSKIYRDLFLFIDTKLGEIEDLNSGIWQKLALPKDATRHEHITEMINQLTMLYAIRANIFNNKNKSHTARINKITLGSVNRKNEKTKVADLMAADPRLELVPLNDKITGLQIPMRNNASGNPTTTKIQIQSDLVSPEYLLNIFSDWINNGSVTKSLKANDIFKYLNSVLNIDVIKKYLDFGDKNGFHDIRITKEGLNLIGISANKDKYINITQIEDFKYVEAIINEITNPNKKFLFKSVVLDVSSNKKEIRTVFILKNNKLKLSKLSIPQITSEFSTSNISPIEDGDTLLYHTQATYVLDYLIDTLDEASPIIETIKEEASQSSNEEEVQKEDEVKEDPDLEKKIIKKKSNFLDRFNKKDTSEDSKPSFDSISIEQTPLSESTSDSLLLKYKGKDLPYLKTRDLVRSLSSQIKSLLYDAQLKNINLTEANLIQYISEFYDSEYNLSGDNEKIYLELATNEEFLENVWKLVKSNLAKDNIKFTSSNKTNSHLKLTDDNSEEIVNLESEDTPLAERYDKSVSTINDYSKVSIKLKLRISQLNTGNFDSFGMPEYFDAEEIYQDLKGKLANKSNLTFEEVLNIIKGVKNRPDYITLAEQLKTLTPQEISQFMTSFINQKTTYYIKLFNTKGGLEFKIIDAGRNSGGHMLFTEWRANYLKNNTVSSEVNFLTQTRYTKPAINELRQVKEEWEELINEYGKLDYQTFKQEYVKTKNFNVENSIVSKISSLMNKMGIPVTPEIILDIVLDPLNYSINSSGYSGFITKDLLNEKTGIIGVFFNPLNEIPNVEQPITEEYFHLDRGGNYFTNLAKYIFTLTPNADTASQISADNNQIYSYIIYNPLVLKAEDFKNSPWASKDFSLGTFNQNNDFVENPYDFQIIISDAIKDQEANEVVTSYSANPKERLVEVLNGVLRGGYSKRTIRIPTTSDKSSVIDIEVPALNINEDTFMSFRKYIEAETNRIEAYIKYLNDGGKLINSKFDKGYKFYHLHPELNYAIARDTLTQLITNNFDLIEDNILGGILYEEPQPNDVTYNNYVGSIEYFANLAIKNNILNELSENKEDDIITQVVDTILDSVYNRHEDRDVAIINNEDFGAALIKLELENQINRTKRIFNRLNMTSSLLDSTWVDKVQNDINDFKILNPEGKNEALLDLAVRELVYYSKYYSNSFYQAFSGDPAISWKGENVNPITSKPEEIKKAIMKTSREMVKRNAKLLASGVKPYWNILNENNEFEIQETFNTATIQDDSSGTLIQSIKDNEVVGKFYENIERTDAAELTTAEEAVQYLFAQGKIDNELYPELLRKARAQDKLKWDSKVSNKDKFTNEEINQLLGAATKPVYVGSIYLDDTKSIELPYYVKSAAFPIIHQVYAGTDLAKIKGAMSQKQISRLAYESAVKQGAINPTKIWDDQGNLIEDALNNIQPIGLNRRGLLNQQDIPYKESKHEILVLSQMDKFITEGLVSMSNDKEWAKGIINRKHNVRTSLFKQAKSEFERKFGITEDNPIPDVKKVREILLKEATERGLPTNAINSIEIIDGKLVIPLFFNPYANKYESILTSIISKIVKQHMHGHSYVQMPSKGVKSSSELTETQLNDIIPIKGHDKTQELKFVTKENGVVEAAEVYIPWKFAYTDGKISNINDYVKNGYLDTDKVPPELLRLIGARIPNQGPNSQLPIKIVGFLPKYMGNTIIVPAEISAQMGSDYDVDKLYTYMPHYSLYNQKGVKKIKVYNSVEERKDKIRKRWIKEYQDQFSLLELQIKNANLEVQINTEELNKRKNIISNDDVTTEESILDNNEDLIEDFNKVEEEIKASEEYDASQSTIEELQNQIDIVKTRLNELKKESTDLRNERNSKIENEVKEELKKDIPPNKKDLQNEYFNIHWEVLTHPGMYERVTSSLDMKDLAIEADKKRNNETDNSYSVSDFEFNFNSFFENKSGKDGVAIEAAAIVFNAILQTVDTQFEPKGGFSLYTQVYNKKTEMYDVLPIEINVSLPGIKGKVALNTLGKDSRSVYNGSYNQKEVENRRITDNIQNIQSEAVDNAKNVNLGVLNFNEHTFSAINALLQLSGEVDGELLSVANDYIVSFITSPPIIEFIREKENKFSLFDTKFTQYEYDAFKDFFAIPNLFNLKLPSKTQLDSYNELPIEKQKILDHQILSTFFVLEDLGRHLSKIGKALDASTKGIGKSFIESYQKELNYNKYILDSENNSSSSYKIGISNIEVLSQSEWGIAMEESVIFGNNIFSEYFPYRNLINYLEKYSEYSNIYLDESTLRDIFNNYKAFILANDKLYTSTVNEERQRLLEWGSKENIFVRFDSFKNSTSTNPDNIILRELLKDIVLDENKGVYKLAYAGSRADLASTDHITSMFLTLLKSKDESIKNFVTDLVTYVNITNPVQGSTNFSKFIPVQVYFGPIINNHLQESNVLLSNPNASFELFLEQLVQSNPKKYSNYYNSSDFPKDSYIIPTVETLSNDAYKGKDKQRGLNLQEQISKLNNTSVLPYVYISQTEDITHFGFYAGKKVLRDIPYKVTRTNTGELILTKMQPTSNYDFREFNSSGRITSSYVKSSVGVTNDFDLLKYGISTTPNNAKAALMRISNSENRDLASIANVLLETGVNVDIVYDEKLKSAGNYKNGLITINPANKSFYKEGNEIRDLEATIIHEIWHHISSNYIEIFENTPNKLPVNIYNALFQLNNVRKEVLNQMVKDDREGFNTFLSKLEKLNNPTTNKYINQIRKDLGLNSISVDGNITSEEKSKYYGLLNLHEFVSQTFSDGGFQEILNNKPSVKNKIIKLFNRLFNAVIEALGIQVNEGSNLAITINESLNLLNPIPQEEASKVEEKIPTETKKRISLARLNYKLKSINKKLKAKGNIYIEIDSNGNEIHYHRISTLNPNGKRETKEVTIDTILHTSRGNILDTTLRDFINMQDIDLTEFKILFTEKTNEERIRLIDEGIFQDKLQQEFPKFTSDFVELLYYNYKNFVNSYDLEFISDVNTLWGEINGEKYAGTIDLLARDKSTGSVYIIDLKSTMKDLTSSKEELTLEKYSAQQSGYAELFKQRTGIEVNGIFLFPQIVTRDPRNNSYFIDVQSTDNILIKVDFNRNIYKDTTNLELTTPTKKGEPINYVPSQPNDEILFIDDFNRIDSSNDVDYLYLFTDNLKRTSGSNNIPELSDYITKYGKGKKYPIMTQAVLRGLGNSAPITTMKDDNKTQFTEEDFELYKQTIDDEIKYIQSKLLSGQYKGIKMSNSRIGKGTYSNLPFSLQNYLDSKLKELGIDNTGNKPKLYNKNPISSNASLEQDLINSYKVTKEYPDSKFPVNPSNTELELLPEIEKKWGRSIEAWYSSNNAKANNIEEGIEADQWNYNLMSELITDKLLQYPELIKQIEEQGGEEYLKTVTGNSEMFNLALITAFNNVKNIDILVDNNSTGDPMNGKISTMQELQSNPDFIPLNIQGKKNTKGEVNDTAKMKLGNKLIAFGEEGSSTENNQTQTPDVILPIGTSGSGKSTFIKSLPQENLVIIEPDAMRVEFTGDMNNKSKDKEIYIEAAQRAIKAIKQGKQVVFDTTNLTKDKRLPFIEAIKKEIPNANIQYKLMELNPELAKERIKNDIKSQTPKGTINVYWKQPESSTSTRILSNLAPRKFTYESTDGITRKYNSVEQAYQSNKNGKFDKVTYDAYVAKGGYGVKISPKLTDVGKRGNLQLMKDLVVESFEQNPNSDAAKKLIQYAGFTHNTNQLIDEAFLEGLKLAQKKLLSKIERANVSDETIDRHAESYKQMLEDIKNEPITPYGEPRTYSSKDIVNISVNGNYRPNQAENVEKTKQEILKAIKQGVNYFVADTKKVAYSSHNINGEGAIADWFENEVSKNYNVKYKEEANGQAGVYIITKKENNTVQSKFFNNFDSITIEDLMQLPNKKCK